MPPKTSLAEKKGLPEPPLELLFARFPKAFFLYELEILTLKNWLFAAAALLVFGGQSFAQRQAARFYTTSDGLQINELMTVFVDSQGRVWAGSSQGLAVFDGKTMRRFGVREGLGPSMVDRILESPTGEIWVVQVGSKNEELFANRLLPSGLFQRFSVGSEFGIENAGFFFDPKTRFLTLEKDSIRAFFDAEKGIFQKAAEAPTVEKPLADFKNLIGDSWQAHRFESGTAFLVSSKGLFFHDEKGWRQVFAEKIKFLPNIFSNAISGAPDGQTAFCAARIDERQFALLALDDAGNVAEKARFRCPFEVRSLARDRAGNFWAATTGGLLKIFPAFFDLPVEDFDGLADIHSLAEDRDGRVWFGTVTHGMSFFDGQKMQSAPLAMRRFTNFLPGSMRDETGMVRMVLSRSLLGFDGRGRIEISPQKNHQTGYFLNRARDGEVVFGMSSYGLAIRKKGTVGWDSTAFDIHGPEKGFELVNVLTAAKDRFGRWWVGRSAAGIAVLTAERDRFFNFLRKNPTADPGAMASAVDAEGNIWWGTTRGLAFFEPKKDMDLAAFSPARDFLFFEKSELGGDPIMSMALLGDSVLVCGNGRGIALVDLKTFYSSGKTVLPVHFFDEKNGYLGGSCEQNAIWIDREGRVWIGADGGAVRFDPRLFRWEKKPPRLRIDSLVSGGRAFLPLKKRLQLEIGQRSARIFFAAEVDSTLQTRTFFRYKFSKDTAWSEATEAAFVDFPNLAPDDYALEVQAWRDGVPSETERVEFRINEVLYKRWWFWPILMLVGFIGWALYYRAVLALERSKQEKNRLQVQAVVNQLNPHFINNALQFVQVRVFQDKEATRVLSKLGENIRLVFRNTRDGRPFHSLSDEMTVVENYLAIQKARFGERLEYELPDGDVISKNGYVPVPLMMLQIHCENAVEHGLGNREEGGRVKIEIKDGPDALQIQIEDDGVGRARAQEIGSKGTQQGIKMLRQIQAIFNRRNPVPLLFDYEDLPFRRADGEPCGTRVIIQLPKKYSYELGEK